MSRARNIRVTGGLGHARVLFAQTFVFFLDKKIIQDNLGYNLRCPGLWVFIRARGGQGRAWNVAFGTGNFRQSLPGLYPGNFGHGYARYIPRKGKM